jgi:effector-binding domain-containing protein
MAEISVVDLHEQPTVGLREVVPMDALTAFFDRAFSTTYEAVQAHGGQVAGPPYARYFGPATDSVDVEAGFPVVAPVAVDGPVTDGALPAGRGVETVHEGAYDGLAHTYEAMVRGAQERGIVPAGDMWEVYLTDPGADPDPATWRTRVVMLVR